MNLHAFWGLRKLPPSLSLTWLMETSVFLVSWTLIQFHSTDAGRWEAVEAIWERFASMGNLCSSVWNLVSAMDANCDLHALCTAVLLFLGHGILWPVQKCTISRQGPLFPFSWWPSLQVCPPFASVYFCQWFLLKRRSPCFYSYYINCVIVYRCVLTTTPAMAPLPSLP